MRSWRLRRRFNRRRFRRNPDDLGPSLYNPLEDKDHPFKNDSAYKKIIKGFYSKKGRRRRNPFRRNPIPFSYGAGEDTRAGLYGPIFRGRRRRNPSFGYAPEEGRGLYRSIFSRRRRRRRHNPDEGTGLFRSLYARRRRNRRRRNPLGYTFEEGRGLYRSIFSRRRRRRHRRRRNPSADPNTQIFNQDIFARRRFRRRRSRRFNPLGYYELPTYDTGDAYWDRGRT